MWHEAWTPNTENTQDCTGTHQEIEEIECESLTLQLMKVEHTKGHFPKKFKYKRRIAIVFLPWAAQRKNYIPQCLEINQRKVKQISFFSRNFIAMCVPKILISSWEQQKQFYLDSFFPFFNSCVRKFWLKFYNESLWDFFRYQVQAK